MTEGRRFALVDVLPERVFRAQRLPGARRATVYEVTFLDQIKELGLNPKEPVVLYGAGEDALDSSVAAEKLDRAGFQQIFDFRGGRAEWAQMGGRFEGDGMLPPSPQPPADRRYSVDPEQSRIEWIGRNLNTTHHGTIRVESGHITVSEGALVDGQVTLDMRTVDNDSVADPTLHGVLNHHLKSDDFFDVERYPTAELKIRSAQPLAGATPGTPNFQFQADLKIKDVTREIVFSAIVACGEDGAFASVAQIEIDRTEWGVIYGSGRFFKMLGMHLVNDAITLLVKLIAR